ncbi:hypothetical protein GQ55_9G214200 [Panicum hallii var. hallii]|uniref:Uncharacterized protein n=1 Tax=Panicum hallii var. hallii TaxID=1504633 RepID=A0A2T7C5M7_9POAL|nr:hypothetical protein GQ55_9G214200 [Panicum hallii var. hallii]
MERLGEKSCWDPNTLPRAGCAVRSELSIQIKSKPSKSATRPSHAPGDPSPVATPHARRPLPPPPRCTPSPRTTSTLDLDVVAAYSQVPPSLRVPLRGAPSLRGAAIPRTRAAAPAAPLRLKAAAARPPGRRWGRVPRGAVLGLGSARVKPPPSRGECASEALEKLTREMRETVRGLETDTGMSHLWPTRPWRNSPSSSSSISLCPRRHEFAVRIAVPILLIVHAHVSSPRTRFAGGILPLGVGLLF